MIKYFKNIVISADPSKDGVINWLKSLGFQLMLTGSIFTALQVFFELDKFFIGNDFSVNKIIIYTVLWLLISSKSYLDWKAKHYGEKEKD